MTNLLSEIPEFLDNSLKNITDEPTKSIGTLLKDAIFLKFGSVSYKAEKLRILQKYGLKEFEINLAKRINEIPKNKLQIPDFQTVTQAIGDMESCINSEDLREMFANLIARSCNYDFANSVHPSFSGILRQMSPYDAKILKFYINNRVNHLITYRYKKSNGERFDRIPYTIDSYPNLDESDHMSIAISSLMRLGILSIQDDTLFCPAKNSLFENSIFYKNCEQERIKDGIYSSSSINKQMSYITSLGEAFIRSCC